MQSIIAFFNKPLLKISLAIGLLTGLLAFGYFLGLYWLDVTPLGNIRVPDFGIHLIMMGFACWYYRRKIGHGFLHLWEALTICYVVNMVAAFITGWLIYFFITFEDPQIYTDYLANLRELMLEGKEQLVANIGEPEFEKLLAGVANNKPADVISDEISKKFLLGIIPILIISLIFRKQKLVTEERN